MASTICNGEILPIIGRLQRNAPRQSRKASRGTSALSAAISQSFGPENVPAVSADIRPDARNPVPLSVAKYFASLLVPQISRDFATYDETESLPVCQISCRCDANQQEFDGVPEERRQFEHRHALFAECGPYSHFIWQSWHVVAFLPARTTASIGKLKSTFN